MTVHSNIRLGQGVAAASTYLQMPPVLMAPLGRESLGMDLPAGTFGTSTGWPTANMAFFWPIDVSESYVVTKAFAVFGTPAAGNVDFGIYDTSGNRLASTGSTAVSAVTDLQSVALSYTMAAGRYFFAMSCDSTSTLVYRTNSYTVLDIAQIGAKQTATSFVLPSSVVFADFAAAQWLPVAGLTNRSVL